MEQAVRAGGAVPATIGVIAGRLRAGLSAEEVERLGRPGAAPHKCAALDLAAVMAAGLDGTTTVSATSWVAARLGIAVFATGGIGGVHRGPGGDVSSDLHTLAGLPVAIVSAGAKSILDIPRTVELLETLGVLVLGYQTSVFPAFYTADSGIGLQHRVEDAVAAARVIRARFALGQGGVLVANPPPAALALDRNQLEGVVDRALAAADAQEIRGKELTPFLLSRVAAETRGASVACNRALAVANATVAGEIARALSAPTEL
jgi:pseudouridine-5'-phosphate glycosidase